MDIKFGTPTIIPKGWGYEIIFASNDMYCGKILHFNIGGMTSMHFHANKTETWYVYKGKFIVRTIDPKNASKHEATFTEGMTFHINKVDIHQVIALTEGDIIEVSTKDDASDSYRVEAGSSQLNK
jgi:oxalate decarboxylase/phosphoglucose isomerase-like protein (cupin superfamily)